jgi:hypothetical protein
LAECDPGADLSDAAVDPGADTFGEKYLGTEKAFGFAGRENHFKQSIIKPSELIVFGETDEEYVAARLKYGQIECRRESEAGTCFPMALMVNFIS